MHQLIAESAAILYHRVMAYCNVLTRKPASPVGDGESDKEAHLETEWSLPRVKAHRCQLDE